MMTSYERVKRALYFQKPDRLPALFSVYNHSDIHGVSWNQIGTGDRSKRHTLDEWGCTWSRSEVSNMGLCNGHPLEDWDAMDTYCWPDPDDEKFYTVIEAHADGSEGKGGVRSDDQRENKTVVEYAQHAFACVARQRVIDATDRVRDDH